MLIDRGFYKIKNEYFELINKLGGTADVKNYNSRPILCFKDNKINGLYWMIPTSDILHRTPEQIKKYINFIEKSKTDKESAYYYIGYTNRLALYKISGCFPIVEKYIDGEYICLGRHLKINNDDLIDAVYKRMKKILSYEGINKNSFEQHITDVKTYLLSELEIEKSQQEAAQTKAPVQLNKMNSFE